MRFRRGEMLEFVFADIVKQTRVFIGKLKNTLVFAHFDAKM